MIINNNYIDGEGRILFYNCSQIFSGNFNIMNNVFLFNKDFDKDKYDLIISTSEDFNDLTIKNCVFIKNDFYDYKIPHIKKLSDITKYQRRKKLIKISEI